MNLEPPYGDCGRSNISYFGNDKYTRIRCDRQCHTDKVTHTCHCKDAYLPGMSVYIDFCFRKIKLLSHSPISVFKESSVSLLFS